MMSVCLKLKISVTSEPIELYSSGNIPTGPVMAMGAPEIKQKVRKVTAGGLAVTLLFGYFQAKFFTYDIGINFFIHFFALFHVKSYPFPKVLGNPNF